MEQEEEESDDDGKALHAALEIIEDFQKGVDVSTLEDRVKALPQSPTIGTIHEALAVIIRNASHSKTTRTPSPTWNGGSTPYPFRDSSDCETNQRNGMVNRMLSLSPAMQTGTSDCDRVHDNAQPAVPRLQLELDFSPSSSVNHSPLLTPRCETPNDVSRGADVGRITVVPHCCHECRAPRSYLNASDFAYLLIFGLITSLILYYLYSPPLYKGPVY